MGNFLGKGMLEVAIGFSPISVKLTCIIITFERNNFANKKVSYYQELCFVDQLIRLCNSLGLSVNVM